MHTDLKVAVGEGDAVKGIVYIFAPWRINTDHIDCPEILPDGFFLLGDGKLIALRWEAGVCRLAELPDLDVVF